MPKNRNPSNMRHFWAYDETPEGAPAVLRLEGPIDTETWWGDEVTPDYFRQELEAHPGDIEVYINSPGGDVIAASMIYTMLMEHKGRVTVKIEGIAASAASIVAMAGTTVRMAPTAYMMIHNASSIAWGNKHEMAHEAAVLDEIDRGIRDAYRLKTGLRDGRIEQLMEDETWMSARTCIELGFADGYIGADPEEPEEDPEEDPDEEGPDARQLHARMVAALGGSRGQIAVAYSGHRQLAALRQMLRDEETHGAAAQIFDLSRGSSAEGGTDFATGQSRLASANHMSLKALIRTDEARKQLTEVKDTADFLAMAAAATNANQRLKLQLLSI